MTGIPVDTIVTITTWANDSATNITKRGYFAVGVAKTWRDPVIIYDRPLFFLPDEGNYQNDSCITEPWKGWLYEDPYFYFDRQLKRWRALFHQARRCPSTD